MADRDIDAFYRGYGEVIDGLGRALDFDVRTMQFEGGKVSDIGFLALGADIYSSLSAEARDEVEGRLTALLKFTQEAAMYAEWQSNPLDSKTYNQSRSQAMQRASNRPSVVVNSVLGRLRLPYSVAMDGNDG